MSLAATVLIPTHDHGPLLAHALRSASNQTVQDLEILVVGDGVPDSTRDLIRDVMRDDERVRFFDNPKGPRHGEIHRHAALREARGRIVCYLSDDDLWLPNHVETLVDLLKRFDLAHTLPVCVLPHQEVWVLNGDLSLQFYKDLLLAEVTNFLPPSCVGHTMEMYRRLPFGGWRTTPEDMHTDLHMWRQFLIHPGCRTGSEPLPTMLHFPSSQRPHLDEKERLEELVEWAKRIEEPGFSKRFAEQVVAALARDRVALRIELEYERRNGRAQGRRGDQLLGRVAEWIRTRRGP